MQVSLIKPTLAARELPKTHNKTDNTPHSTKNSQSWFGSQGDWNTEGGWEVEVSVEEALVGWVSIREVEGSEGTKVK